MNNTYFSTLKNKDVAVFYRDPGGAKLVLSLIEKYQSYFRTINIYGSKPKFNLFNISGASFHEGDSFKPKFLNDVNLVITATSYPPGLELEAISEATEKKIRTIVLLDRASNFQKRFTSCSELILPDDILCVEELFAKDLALCSGVRVQKIRNKFLEKLSLYSPKTSKCAILDNLNLLGGVCSKYILYAPEPISAFNLNDEYGFDEVEALQKIINTLNDFNLSIVVLEHENQSFEAFNEIYARLGIIKISKADRELFSMYDYIFYSEAVLTFNSSIVLEALTMRKQVIRPLWFMGKKIDSLSFRAQKHSLLVDCHEAPYFVNHIEKLFK